MTSQIGETLILNGKKRNMAFCPPLPPHEHLLIPTTRKILETRISKKRKSCQTIECWVDADGRLQSEEAAPYTYSTACWRQYIGTWELKDGLFYLVSLTGRYRLAPKTPMFADWVTGVLRVKLGPMLCYVHMGFGSVTAKELHIHIENGHETGRRMIDNRGRTHDETRLGWANLPGGENRFAGDGELND